MKHGRGTCFPFTIIGNPELKDKYNFTAQGILGMAENPIFKVQVCYGIDLRDFDVNELKRKKQINVSWIMELYNVHPNKEKIFDFSMSNQNGSN